MADDPTAEFRGEDESAGAAPPVLDLVASAVLLALGLFFAVLSLALPVPGQVLSAPGLLPFLVSASLAVMALLLGLSAWRRYVPGRWGLYLEARATTRRTAAIVALTVYLGALQVLHLEGFVPLFGAQIPVGGFEPATMVFLAVLLRFFWTERLFPILAVSVGWTLCLSFAFRGLFGIPLPG